MEPQIAKQIAVAPHSVEVERTAKGEFKFIVKVYDDDPALAVKRAVAAVQSLKADLGITDTKEGGSK